MMKLWEGIRGKEDEDARKGNQIYGSMDPEPEEWDEMNGHTLFIPYFYFISDVTRTAGIKK